MMISVDYFKDGADEGDVPFTKVFPGTKFCLNKSKRTLKYNDYDKMINVKIYRLSEIYTSMYDDWDFEEELKQMIFGKSMDEIEKIAEQLEVLECFQMLIDFEVRCHEAKIKNSEKKYEEILQQIITKFHNKDERGYLIPEELL